ncbi:MULTISPECIES: glycerophosphodiester phosphodiesterase family protein [unclassified Myroides]|uniref:glycerophosphodiester phosphodiesterase n=1 Tax=unclassified Myroides TaxID=2642485 RepID=UPI0015FDFAF8|nr:MULTISPECIES: glycerophosphodiester phosphodiesterase family protein [unclassified Myroides]MBB1151202.1 glycerophosphodiester phosphodiesterase [Myroides sp. NP-2]MDM1408736.1 glycerophosphodiester phosphodiesterase [Myroides sp. DF42-4-2]
MKLNAPFLSILCTIITSTAIAQESKTLRIGHRGAMGHITENTVESVNKAIDLQCDMIEIDVYKIKSGELVVFHDETLDRVSNAKGRIESYTLEELEYVVVGGKYKIPTLEEVIDAIGRKSVLNIELKGSNTAVDTHRIIHNFMERGWSYDDFILSSFKWEELKIAHDLDPLLPLAVLTEKKPEDAIEFALSIQAKAINPYHKMLNTENTALIKKEKLKIYPWTVNDTKDIERMKKLKVDGIITNFPERI